MTTLNPTATAENINSALIKAATENNLTKLRDILLTAVKYGANSINLTLGLTKSEQTLRNRIKSAAKVLRKAGHNLWINFNQTRTNLAQANVRAKGAGKHSARAHRVNKPQSADRQNQKYAQEAAMLNYILSKNWSFSQWQAWRHNHKVRFERQEINQTTWQAKAAKFALVEALRDGSLNEDSPIWQKMAWWGNLPLTRKQINMARKNLRA